MPQPIRWINQSQPQTLVYSTIFAYFGAVVLVIASFSGSTDQGLHLLAVLVGVALANVLGAAGLVGTGWGIANEKKWGWYLGLVMSAIELVSFAWLVQQSGLDFNLMLGSLFAVMHAVLILHTDSRAYVRIWFK